MDRRYCAVAVVAGALTLTACGPQPSPQPQLDAALRDIGQRDALQCDPGKEHWRTEGAPLRGGVFKLGVSSAPSPAGLDPTQLSASAGLLLLVFERLVTPRACYFEDTVMTPGLAKSWEVSADGLVWTLSLKEDARWHNKPPVNGRTFEAGDVAWTVEHQRKGGILRSYWDTLVHEEPDALHVVLRLPEPDADFLAKLGEGLNVMLPREVQEQFGDFKTVSIGTGAYTLKSFVPEQLVVLERTPNWREQGVDGKPLPYIDELQQVTLGDYAAEVAAIRSRQTDLNGTQGFNKLDADILKQANPKLKAYNDISAPVWSLWFNLSKPPFNEVRVRRALALALDPDEIVQGGFQGGGVRSGFISAGIKEYAWTPPQIAEKFKPNRERARQMLAEAGVAGDREYLLETAKQYSQDGEIVQAQLRAAGLNLKFVPDPGSLTPPIMRRATFELAWGAITGSSYLLDHWVYATMRTGASFNASGLSDPEVDALAVAQRREFDPAKRKLITDRLQDRLYDLMPWVPGLNKIYYRFYSCRVKNMKPTHPSRDLEGINRAWLEATAC